MLEVGPDPVVSDGVAGAGRVGSPGRLAILIADDEASSRHMLAALLAREDHEIVFACSSQEALAQFAARLPDVALIDVIMAEMNGLELCRRIKATPAWRHVPIILVTSLDGKEELARGLDAGADDFLTKPVNGIELRARVRAMARIKRQHDELTRLMTLREDLAHMAAHDMRGPLGVILGYAALLARSPDLTESDAKRAEKIRAHAVILNSFLNQMLLMAKLEEGRLILNLEPIEVHTVILATEEDRRPEADSRGVRLVVSLPAERRTIDLDPDLFARVIDNLWSNAIKFSPAHSTVKLVAEYPPESEGRKIRVRIEDEGPGIPEEQREQIFEKFGAFTARQAGVLQIGLGLPFCRMVAEAHGGRVFMKPNEPQGSIFTLEI